MNCKHLLGFWATKNGYECATCGQIFSKEEYETIKKEQVEKIRTCSHGDTMIINGTYHSHTICTVCGKRLD